MKTKDQTTQRTPTPILAQRLEALLRNTTVWNDECKFILRAVNSHEALTIGLSDMAKKWHDICDHSGYFHNCEDPLCKDNREAIALAEGGK